MACKSCVLYDPASYRLYFLFLAHKCWKTTHTNIVNWNIVLQISLCKAEEQSWNFGIALCLYSAVSNTSKMLATPSGYCHAKDEH